MTRINVVPVQELTRQYLVKILEENDYYVSRVARLLNMCRSSIERLMRQHGISKIRKRGERPIKDDWKCKNDPRFTRIRNTWYKIKKRCLDSSNKDYKHYGNRGITLYEPWKNDLDSFYNYCRYLNNSFKKGFTIDRINNDGGYEPNNIRFVKHKIQCNNRRSNVLYEYNGKVQNIAQWSEEYHLTWTFVRDRLKLGWTIQEALTIPKYGRKKK
jgi:hypothetical protein